MIDTNLPIEKVEYNGVNIPLVADTNLTQTTITPTEEQQTITAPDPYDGFNEVIVERIPAEYIVPRGTIDITQNNEVVDVAQFATANINVAESNLLAKQILSGTLEEYDNTQLGLTSLATDRFIQFPNLRSLNLTGIFEIPEYTCENCTSLSSLVLDSEITSIGEYAFAFCPITNFALNTNQVCNVEQYAFRQTGLIGISGKLGNVGQYAFSNLISSQQNFNVTINGTIGNYAFANNYTTESFNISSNSNVGGTLGDYAFSGVGSSRINPETKVFDLDFSNGKISTINQYAFGTSSSTYKNRYYSIQFPATLGTINSYAFRYSDNMTLYFKGLVPASLNSNAFSNTTNLKICVNYASVNAYKTATNWATYASSIIGYADRNTFNLGQQLPQYSLEGYALTWYSDINLSNEVTTADNSSQYYYCTLGTEQVDVVGITSLYEDNCNIVVANALTGYQYTEGEGILVGTQLTITATPTISGYIPYILTFNGIDFTSPYDYTTVTGTNLNLVGIYYDGEHIPVNPEFAQNSWAIIKSVIQSGTASQYWTVGQIKEIEIDGLTYGIRLADLQSGRYNYANSDKTTNAVLEFIQLYNTSYRMNATGTNAGGWATAELQTTINTTILNKIPMELRSLLEQVVVASANTGSADYEITTSDNYLFVPCAAEVNLSTSYGRAGEGTTWDYYINAVNATRVKMKPGSTSGTGWWLRSPYPGSTFSFSFVYYSGYGSDTSASSTYGVCPCFAW